MQKESAVIPAPRNVEYDWMSIARWNKMHNNNRSVAKNGNSRLLFLGDSLTEGHQYDPEWKRFKPFDPANFGIGGDKTQNVLWRLEHGEIGKLDPEVVVLLIGVNNFGHLNHNAEEVFQGTKLIIQKIILVFPQAKILLMGVFPFEQYADHTNRTKVKDLNALNASLADGKRIHFMDIGEQFLEPNGSISPEMMEDYLHIGSKGYKIWTDAIHPVIENWLGSS